MSFAEVIRARKAVKEFASTPIPNKTLAEILRLTQRAPTSFNTQPYSVVIVRDQDIRDKLSEKMLAANVGKVKAAPVIAVFAADTEPNLRIPRIQELMRESGVPPFVVDIVPGAVKTFSQHELPEDAPKPLNAPTVAWAFKQTSLAAATLLYAAQGEGVSTCPMEGFNEAGVREVLEIPERYKVSIVVALGYPKEGYQFFDTARLPPTEVFYEGKFGASSSKIFEA